MWFTNLTDVGDNELLCCARLRNCKHFTMWDNFLSQPVLTGLQWQCVYVLWELLYAFYVCLKRLGMFDLTIYEAIIVCCRGILQDAVWACIGGRAQGLVLQHASVACIGFCLMLHWTGSILKSSFLSAGPPSFSSKQVLRLHCRGVQHLYHQCTTWSLFPGCLTLFFSLINFPIRGPVEVSRSLNGACKTMKAIPIGL